MCSPCSSGRDGLIRGLRAELVRNRNHDVGREPTAAGMLDDGGLVVGLVDAVDLVASHVAGDPPVRNAERRGHRVRLLGDFAKLRFGQLAGAGDLAFDQKTLHGTVLLDWTWCSPRL